MKICLVTFSDVYYKTILKPLTRSKEKYCEMHGYDFFHESIELNLTKSYKEYDLGWEKLRLVDKYFATYDLVYITDIDTAILDFSVKLEDLIESKDMVVSELQDGFITLGGALWRKTDNTKDILNTLLSFKNQKGWLTEETEFNNLPLKKYDICIDNRINYLYDIHRDLNPILIHYAGVVNPYIIKQKYEKTLSTTRKQIRS